jgi:purine nucleoside phosphorylase
VDLPPISGDRLGLIVGSGMRFLHVLPDAVRATVVTPFGPVTVLESRQVVMLNRHGLDEFTPAHLVNHRSNLTALVLSGCDRILALGSTGGMRGQPVGSVLVPDDFLALSATESFFSDERGHRIPGFDVPWRARVVSTWREFAHSPLHDGGVYAQTSGPRFETAAEIRMLADHADVVGMTIASECILAGELDLAYAAVCTVDNLANGLDEAALTVDQFHESIATLGPALLADMTRVLPHLAGSAA